MADHKNEENQVNLVAIPLLTVSERASLPQAASVGRPLSRDSPTTSSSSPWTRTGTIAMLTLIISILIVAAAICFLYFLWYGTPDNLTWRLIVMSNRVSPTITLTSTVLRTAIALQGGVCLSMLAAIALEKSAIPLPSVGSVSLMRAGGDKGLIPVLTNFVWPLFRWGPRLGLEQLILPTVLLVLTTMTVSQFISTALVSDVAIRPLPSYNKTVSIAYDISYDPKTGESNYTGVAAKSPWEASLPALWPMFAEYSDAPFVQDNVSDTGRSLRAFLPLGAQERQQLRNYTGKSFVFDSRVTCQQPVFTGLASEADTGYTYVGGLVAPTMSTPRLDAPGAVPFAHYSFPDVWEIYELYESGLWSGTANGGAVKRQPQESLIPRNFSGGLVSEFREFPPSPGQNKSGAAFLLSYLESRVPITPGPEFVSQFIGYDGDGDSNTTYYATLCYTSLDFADRWINAYGDVNRTEPAFTWLAGNGSSDGYGNYNITAVATQLDTGYGSLPLPSPEKRDILRIQGPVNWSAPQSDQPSNDGPSDVPIVRSWPPALPWLTSHLHIYNPDTDNTDGMVQLGNYTVSLGVGGSYGYGSDFDLQAPEISTDAWLGALFSYLLETRSSSVALQGVITSLVGIDYYSYLSQFDKIDNVSMVSFVNSNTPGGEFGQRRTATPPGLTTVTVLSVVHTVLVTVVAVRFWSQTTSSRLGDTWQAIAQVALSDIGTLKKILRAAAPEAEDVQQEVEEELEENSKLVSCVYLDEDRNRLKLRVK
ncbi:hypothetical protein V8E51_004816 [Hyaloscypha variabilis]